MMLSADEMFITGNLQRAEILEINLNNNERYIFKGRRKGL